MHREELLQWLDTTASPSKKRRLVDTTVSPGQGFIKRRGRDKTPSSLYSKSYGGKYGCRGERARFTRSRSEGCVDLHLEEHRRQQYFLPPSSSQDQRSGIDGENTGNMDKQRYTGAPLSPISAGAYTNPMPPPSRPASSRRGSTASSISRSSSTSNSRRGDTTSSSYREDVLSLNNVFIVYEAPPVDIKDAATLIVSDKMAEKHHVTPFAHRVAAKSIVLEDENEVRITKELVYALLPELDLESPLLQMTEQQLLNRDLVPVRLEGSATGFLLLSTPKPDMVYGYNLKAFSQAQQDALLIINDRIQRQLSKTAKHLYWGFFIVEVKSQANGGNIYVATNQCAGAGSSCTNGMQQLFKLAYPNDNIPRSKSISFSLAIDHVAASLFVHWYEENKGFYSARLKLYSLPKPKDIEALRRDIDSIVRWGLTTRLEDIRAAFDRIHADEVRLAHAKRRRESDS